MWAEHPLCTMVQTGAHRRCLRSHEVGVVPAPSGAAVLWTAWVLTCRNAKGWGWRWTRGSSVCKPGQCSRSVVTQMLQHQHLVISVSSGTACGRDAVAVSTSYLSPAYCWHSDVSLCLFLGMNGMICHCLELQMLTCGFTSPGHWQTWEESHRLILQTHFSGVERDWSTFINAKCSQHLAWSTWAPENDSKAETITNQ